MSSKARGQSTSANSKLKQGNLFSFFNKKPDSSKLNAAESVFQPSKPTTEDNDKNAKADANQDQFQGTVGQRIEVYWPDDDAWYAADIVKQRGRQHFLEYDDGDTEWIELSNEKVRLIAEPKTMTQKAKRRKIQINDDESENEFKFDDDISANESEYNCNETPDQSSDDLILSDDEKKQSTPPKRKRILQPLGSLSQFKAENMKITEHKYSPLMTSNGENITTPKHVTPHSSKPTCKKTSMSYNSPPVMPMSSLSSSTPVIATGAKPSPPMFIENEVNPPGSHVHNHLKFLQHPKDSCGRPPSHPDYDKRTLQVIEQDWIRITNKPMTDAVKQWWDLKSQYFDTILFFKTGRCCASSLDF
jgi:hypothetical protein